MVEHRERLITVNQLRVSDCCSSPPAHLVQQCTCHGLCACMALLLQLWHVHSQLTCKAEQAAITVTAAQAGIRAWPFRHSLTVHNLSLHSLAVVLQASQPHGMAHAQWAIALPSRYVLARPPVRAVHCGILPFSFLVVAFGYPSRDMRKVVYTSQTQLYGTLCCNALTGTTGTALCQVLLPCWLACHFQYQVQLGTGWRTLCWPNGR